MWFSWWDAALLNIVGVKRHLNSLFTKNVIEKCSFHGKKEVQ